jgi:hypothetical protein
MNDTLNVGEKITHQLVNMFIYFLFFIYIYNNVIYTNKLVFSIDSCNTTVFFHSLYVLVIKCFVKMNNVFCHMWIAIDNDSLYIYIYIYIYIHTHTQRVVTHAYDKCKNKQ